MSLEAVQPNEMLSLAAAAGALFFMVVGYYENKQKNPGIPFDYNYLIKTVVVMSGAAYAFTNVQVMHVSITTLLFAFASGMGIQEGVSQLSHLGTTKKQPKEPIA